MTKSCILVLIICSNNKRSGGKEGYESINSDLLQIESEEFESLITGRNRVLRLIKKGGMTRNGVPIAELPRNKHLVRGRDFGGKSDQGRYFPAAERYAGSFYSQLGQNGPTLLQQSQHHILILSGLYGLLTPTDLIQNYSCHVDDHPNIRRFWTEEDRLTKVLLAYIKRFDISRVLDFSALDSYRRLINWSAIRDAGQDVFHLFGEQTVGDGLLVPLGLTMKALVSRATQNDLLKLSPGQWLETPLDRIYLHSSEKHPNGLPAELEKQIVEFNRSDEVVRLSRCVRQWLRQLTHTANDGEAQREIRDNRRYAPLLKEIKSSKILLQTTRNYVEHESGVVVSEKNIEILRQAYRDVRQWAERQGLDVSDDCNFV